MQFYERFSKDIEKVGWSKNYVSTTFNINRGLLYKYLTGSLLPPKELFYEMIGEMPISKMERMRLLDLYCAEFYGKEKYYRIKEIERIFALLDSTCVPSSVPIHGAAFDSEAFEKTGNAFLQTTGELLSSVQYVCNSSRDGILFTNYPYRFKSLDAELFRIHSQNPDLEFRHFISFHEDLDRFALTQNLFESIRWLQNRVNPVLCYKSKPTDKLQPFPYFIIYNTCVLLMNYDFSSGVLIRDAELTAHLENRYADLQKIEDAVELAVFPEDMFALKNTITENSNAVTEASLTRYACVAATADEAFIYSIMRKDVPGIERLAQLGIDHYANGFGKEIKQYFIQESGFKSFAELGTIQEVPPVYVQTANVEQRIRYFKKMLELNKRGGLKIMKDTLFIFPKAFGITVFDQYIKLYGYFENIPDLYKSYGNWVVSINDNQIFEDLYSFFEYLNDMQIFYSQKGAESFLKSMIIYLGGTV